MASKSKPSLTERQKWEKIFETLVNMLKAQQSQLESLLTERKKLEERIQLQHDSWVCDVRDLEDQISQMRNDVNEQEKFHSLASARSYFLLSLKQIEATVFKTKFEEEESALSGLREAFHYLSHKGSDTEDTSPKDYVHTYKRKGVQDSNSKSIQSRKHENFKALEAEIERLKHDLDKLAAEKNTEISALLAEKDFVWNQYNMLESNYTDKLKTKREEVERANKKVETLVAHMEQLQHQNKDKDHIIAKLQRQMQDNSNKQKEEILRLTQELESLRRSQSGLVTPVLTRCTTKASRSKSARGSDAVKESRYFSRHIHKI